MTKTKTPKTRPTNPARSLDERQLARVRGGLTFMEITQTWIEGGKTYADEWKT